MEAIWWSLLVGWIGSVVFGLIAVVAWKLDCWHERESNLRTPLPVSPATNTEIPTAREQLRSAESCGQTVGATEQRRWAVDGWVTTR